MSASPSGPPAGTGAGAGVGAGAAGGGGPPTPEQIAMYKGQSSSPSSNPASVYRGYGADVAS